MDTPAPSATPLSDGAVIAASIIRPEAFATIFDRHYRAVHRYLARRVGTGLADDLAASAFAVAFEQRHRFRIEAGIARPWLFGIATNLIRAHHRAEQRLLETLAGLGAELATGEVGAGADDQRDLATALAELPIEQRDVLLLLAWGELTYEEIAGTLAIPLGTVRSRLARARGHLRTRLRASAATAPAGPAAADEEER